MEGVCSTELSSYDVISGLQILCHLMTSFMFDYWGQDFLQNSFFIQNSSLIVESICFTGCIQLIVCVKNSSLLMTKDTKIMKKLLCVGLAFFFLEPERKIRGETRHWRSDRT